MVSLSYNYVQYMQSNLRPNIFGMVLSLFSKHLQYLSTHLEYGYN